MYEKEIDEVAHVLGREFATQYIFTKHDLLTLRVQWRTYKTIFGTNKERFDMMFEIANTVAHTLEQTLFEASLLRIRRLTDPANSRGDKKSVTIKSFPPFLDGDEQKEMKRLVSNAEQRASFAREWSNKRIAHADLSYLEGRIRLEPASRQKVTDAIDAVAAPIKWIAKHKLGTTLVTNPISPAENESWFLRHLFEGQSVLALKKKEQRSLMRAGRYDEAKKLDEFPDWLQQDQDEFDLKD